MVNTPEGIVANLRFRTGYHLAEGPMSAAQYRSELATLLQKAWLTKSASLPIFAAAVSHGWNALKYDQRLPLRSLQALFALLLFGGVLLIVRQWREHEGSTLHRLTALTLSLLFYSSVSCSNVNTVDSEGALTRLLVGTPERLGEFYYVTNHVQSVQFVTDSRGQISDTSTGPSAPSTRI